MAKINFPSNPSLNDIVELGGKKWKWDGVKWRNLIQSGEVVSAVNGQTGEVNLDSSFVGLDNVENYPIATQLEAKAGTDNEKYMTPLRTKEAILELSPPTDFTQVGSNIVPTADVTYDLGSATNKWRDLYLSGSTINLGTIQLKDESGKLGVFAADGTTSVEVDLVDGSITDAKLSNTTGQIKDTVSTHISTTTGNPHGVTKSDVGLGNVTNDAQIPLTQKGAASGVAELDANGKVLSSQLPSFVDDVLEYANLAGFPTTGETGKIYIAQDTNLTYRWSGSAYAEISSSLALGETSSTAYRGDRGKTAYDHSQITSGNPHNVTLAELGYVAPTIGNGGFTVTAGSGLTGGGALGTANQTGNSAVTLSHADTSSQASTNNSGRTYIQNITLDTYGHITGITTGTETVVNTDTNTVTRLRGTTSGTLVSGDITLAASGATSISQSGNTITISSTDTNTVYSHPTHPGDDIDIDTGALTGATVISDLDFNITTDTLGHVTDANATIATRNLTAADIGAAPANHTHAYLPLSGGTLTGTLTSRAIAMQNYDLTGVNAMSFNDPGPNEGISWSGGNFSIYESPDDLTTNTAGNLQFVSGGARRLTVGTDGIIDIPGGRIEGFGAQSHSHGSISIGGSKGGYSGIAFPNANAVFMVRDSDALSGVYKNNSTWAWYFDGSGILTAGTVPWARLSGVPTIGDITSVTANNGLTGGGTSGDVTISHADTSSQGSVNNSGGTVIQDISLDTYGHVTSIGSVNLDGRYYTEAEADARFGRFTNDITLNSSSDTASFITELTNEQGCFQNNYRAMKVSWSYAGNSDLNTGDTAIGIIELAGCLIEAWGGTYKHVRITRPTTGSGESKILVYNDQGVDYSPGWRQIWTDKTDGPGSGLNADTVDGVHASSFLTVTNNSSLNADSRNTRGVTRLYRRDDNSDFSVQHYWTGSYWYLRGYNADNFHAEVQVGYANSAGNAGTLDGVDSSQFLRSDVEDLYNPPRLDFGSTGNWDGVGYGNMTNLHFRDHNQFWVGAGNGTWFTGTANAKSQASGLAADASSAHDLLITTMQSDVNTDRGITFAVDNTGAGNSGWRLGKWHSGTSATNSMLAVNGQIHAKGGHTDSTDYYADDYSSYFDDGTGNWTGDSGEGWHKPSVVAAKAIQIQSGTGAVNSAKPQLQFHQYGYGGPMIEYDGPNKFMQFVGQATRFLGVRFNSHDIDNGLIVNYDQIYSPSRAMYINASATTDVVINGGSGGNAIFRGNIYGKDGAGYSNIYRIGGVYFSWDNTTYGTQFNHSITSSYGGSYGDHITLNSYGHIRMNIDSNNNGGNNFEIGSHTTGTNNTLFQITDTGQTNVYTPLNVYNNILLTGGATTTNQARTIDFTGFDKEGTTDFSDRAYIQHTTNTGGHSGSVLVISSQNDSNDGIAFLTNASSPLKWNSQNLATESYVTSRGYITSSASISGNAATATALQTARTINGVSFNGTANITITANPNAHTHGNLSSTGTWAASPSTIGSGDYLVIADSSDSSKLAQSTLQFGTDTTDLLTNAGTWRDFEDLLKSMVNVSISSASTTGGSFSVAVGYGSDARASYSTAVGGEAEAGVDTAHTYSSAFGYDATALGQFDTALGEDASVGSTYDSSTAVGSNASVTASNMFRLGGTNITNLACSDTTISTTSDVRDKADFGEVDKALDLILNLEPVTYVRNPRGRYEKSRDEMDEYETMLWKEYGFRVYDKEEHAKQTKKGTRRQIGFKAQDVAELMQQLYGSDNYAGIVNIDYYDQEIPEEIENRYSVEYARLVPFLVKAIQEQQKQIDELKSLLSE